MAKKGKDPTRGKFPPRDRKAKGKAADAAKLVRDALKGRAEGKVAQELAKVEDIPVKDALAIIRARTKGSQRGNGKHDDGDHFRDP